MSKTIRVAIVGVGNCASALVQGVFFYRANPRASGLMHHDIGGYTPAHVEFSAGFDVDAEKIGRDLSVAIHAGHNCVPVLADVPRLGAKVYGAPVMDGLGTNYRAMIKAKSSSIGTREAAEILETTETHVVLNHLPVGSEAATRFWAQASIEAGCAFVNAIPVFIASDANWSRRFQDAGLPVLGDDLKSLVGATLVHRRIARTFAMRGCRIGATYQLNFGGNMDFRNMVGDDAGRLDSKKKSKTGAVTSVVDVEHIHVSPSDYVPHLEDTKICYINVEGVGFAGRPITLEVKLVVADSPNGAGVALDAVRCAKLALDTGLTGAVIEPSAFLFKTPPRQWGDEQAARLMERYIDGGRRR